MAFPDPAGHTARHRAPDGRVPPSARGASQDAREECLDELEDTPRRARRNVSCCSPRCSRRRSAAGPASCDARSNNTIEKLLECVTLEGVREHQAALQEIADENDGTRVSGSAGYDESVDYAVDVLEAAGYNVTPPVLRLRPVRGAEPVDPGAGRAGPSRPAPAHHHELLRERRRDRGREHADPATSAAAQPRTGRASRPGTSR